MAGSNRAPMGHFCGRGSPEYVLVAKNWRNGPGWTRRMKYFRGKKGADDFTLIDY
jgi:hypothetical protein